MLGRQPLGPDRRPAGPVRVDLSGRRSIVAAFARQHRGVLGPQLHQRSERPTAVHDRQRGRQLLRVRTTARSMGAPTTGDRSIRPRPVPVGVHSGTLLRVRIDGDIECWGRRFTARLDTLPARSAPCRRVTSTTARSARRHRRVLGSNDWARPMPPAGIRASRPEQASLRLHTAAAAECWGPGPPLSQMRRRDSSGVLASLSGP